MHRPFELSPYSTSSFHSLCYFIVCVVVVAFIVVVVAFVVVVVVVINPTEKQVINLSTYHRRVALLNCHRTYLTSFYTLCYYHRLCGCCCCFHCSFYVFVVVVAHFCVQSCFVLTIFHDLISDYYGSHLCKSAAFAMSASGRLWFERDQYDKVR